MYECHITFEMPNGSVGINQLETFAQTRGWKTSFINGDPLLGQKVFFYYTAYHTNLDELKIKMHEDADAAPGKVLRKKIEEIIYDTGRKEAA